MPPTRTIGSACAGAAATTRNKSENLVTQVEGNVECWVAVGRSFPMRLLSLALFVIAPASAMASGDSSQVLALPTVDADGKLTHTNRTFVYPHYYAGVITASESIFSRVCTKTRVKDPEPYSNPAPYAADCDRINPLSMSGLTMSFGIPAADEPPPSSTCKLTIDLSSSRAPTDPRLIRAGLGSRKALVELAIRTLERNAPGGRIYDCPIVYTGVPASVNASELPSLFMPLVSCNAAPGRPAVRARPLRSINGAEQRLRDAVAKDCTAVDPLLDLAAMVARTAPLDETFALLARATKLSKARTFDRFGVDPAFDVLRSGPDPDFIHSYRAERGTRCTEQWLPGAKLASVKIENNACVLTTQKPIAKLGPNQRLADSAVLVSDEKYRPEIIRVLRFRDPSTLVASNSKLPLAQFCRAAFFDFELVGAAFDSIDHCTVSPSVVVLSKAEAEERAFQLANAKPIAEIAKLREPLRKLADEAATANVKCTPEEAKRFAICHPGGFSCDSFKSSATFDCRDNLRWLLDARNIDVAANRAHQQQRMESYLRCILEKSIMGAHLYRSGGPTTCPHGSGISECSVPFPSLKLP